MQMKLISLIIDNFKGVKHFEVNANGENVHIQGKNGTGKTTVYDAFLWLLFGKNSFGESKFSIRPTKVPNEIEPCVSATFTVDGIQKEFKKTFVSKYSRDTGEFRESKLECFINGVPKKIKEYEREISEIIDESLFKLLTNSRFFNEGINWKDRRKTLFEVCGVMNEVDVCNTNEEFACLIEKFNKYGSSEEYQKSLKADKKEISKKINDIPSRIDEVYNQIDNSIDTATEQAKLDILNTKRNDLLTEHNKLKNGTSDTLTKQVQKLENDLFNLNKANREHIEQQTAKSNATNSEYTKKYNTVEQKLSEIKKDINADNGFIVSFNNTLQQARGNFKKINATQWQGDTTCPTCKQPLPSEQIETAKAQFNSNKAKKLDEIKKLAEKTKEDIKQMELNLDNHKKIKTDLKTTLEQLEKEKPISTDVPFNLPNFEEDKKAIETEISKLNAEKQKANSNVNEKLAEIRKQFDEVETKIKETNSLIAKAEMNTQLENRIEELRQEQTGLKAKQSENLRMLDILDKFIKAKIDTIEESINSKFKIARFKLFEQNKTNDSLTECCEVICNNASRYNDINNGGKTIVGIDIIQTLAQHYDNNVPLFIDNVDSLDTDNINKVVSDVEQQVITLKVSDDTKLIIKE